MRGRSAAPMVPPMEASAPISRDLGLRERLIAAWGVFSVLGILAQALLRLTGYAIEPVREGMMGPGHWALYIGWSVFNLYAEGYRGFHKAFNPRVVARAFHLARNPKPLHLIFAGPFCMAMFHAKKKNLILSWGLLSVIVVIVILVRMLPQPWRGIVDAGVVLGLGAGAASLVVQFAQVLFGGPIPETDSFPET